jgi:hypothetical protein
MKVVNSYEIKDVKKLDGTRLKNVTLRTKTGSSKNISKTIERTTDLNTLSRTSGGDVINECYIDLTLDKLREIDDDRTAQEDYILSRAKFLERGYLNVLIVKLRIGSGQKLDKMDYEYLNNLLVWSKNGIYVMPTLEFDTAIPRDVHIPFYEDFMNNMLKVKKDWYSDNVNIGAMVPSFYPQRRIESLLGRYNINSSDPIVIAIDFNNSRIDSRPGDVVNKVLSYLDEKKAERTFLYGVNVKPFKKGENVASALDIHSVHLSFNALGPTHSKPQKTRAIIPPNDWASAGKIYQHGDYSYHRLDDPPIRDEYISWMEKSYGVELSTDFTENKQNSTYTSIKRYNFEHANKELFKISVAIKKNDKDAIEDLFRNKPEGL